MKLSIIGGGGFRVPLVYQALVSERMPLIDEVWLHDTSASRLAVIESVLSQLPHPIPVHGTTVLDQALEGSDFVFSAMRVGGLAGRIEDERTAIERDVIGQETTGPGGIAYALRTIPVALRMAERVRALAPDAYVINFTNPAGMITEAMREVLGDRVIGICDTPSGLGTRIAELLDVPAEEVRLDYAGLNHLGWLRGAFYQSRDLVTEILGRDEALAQLEEAQIMGADWLRTLGMIPNEYLYYYYFDREALRAVRGETRGEYLLGQQDGFYREAAADPADALAAWQRALSERVSSYMAEARPEGTERPASGGGYEYVALGLMRAIALDEPRTMILNVRNGDALPGLPSDSVVEVPCHVDGKGARPVPVTAPSGAELGLLQQVKAVEQYTIGAARDRDPESALKAFALHPLVDSVPVARELLAAYRRNTPTLFGT
ncbi:MAG TPA: 6-phospho-beta-glucosidase [Streptosporangiaceae bacterium]